MTTVLITGAAGFLGRRLTRAILRKGTVAGADGRQAGVTRMILADRAAVTPPVLEGVTFEALQGDLADPAFVETLGAVRFDSLFHLASALTIQAEEDPGTAYAVNVAAFRHLVEGAAGRPRVVFTSSIAVFGSQSPKAAGDDAPFGPETAYGTHKAINELLLADASRRGRVDGRALRLPIVLTRPGAPQPSVADRVAAIVREPLAGTDATVPLRPGTALPIGSAGAVTRALLALHDAAEAGLPGSRALNLPSLSVTAAGLAEAVRRRGAAGTITFRPDPRLQAIVDGWPHRLVSQAALRLGIAGDADSDALIDDHLNHEED